MKKILFRVSTILLSLMFINSCTDNDIKYVATVPAEGQFVLSANHNSIVLHQIGAAINNAITFQWDSLTYGLSTAVIYTIQIDTLNGNFISPLEEEIGTNFYSISYTDSVLNKKLLNLLQLKPDVESQIKIRLKANMSFGNMPIYSNVLNIKVTPYSVSKVASFLYMPGDLSGGWEGYTTKLCSKNNDGKYEGYVQASEWANFKFTTQENFTASVYGSVPNSLYSLSDNKDTQWNIWFDEGGYFLVKADLNVMTWKKTSISSFCVTGDFNSWSLTANIMTYDASTKLWTANCNISTIGYGIQIIGNGDWNFKFGDNDDGKDDGELTAGGNNIIPTSTGNKTVTMDLSNPEKYTYTIQ